MNDSTRQLKLSEPMRLIAHFLHLEATGGIVLLVCAVVALVWANSPLAASYFALWETKISLGIGDGGLSKTLGHWINDGLMVLFFFLVGLEIKREFLAGALASVRRALLPVAAALGGMLVPALLFVALNAGTEAIRGWGIPMATDIAFAVGVLALVGSRVPDGLKALLLAVAIVDDIGAVLVIALFYTDAIAWSYLGYAALGIAALAGANRLGARQPLVYVVVGVFVWLMVLYSGVHATVAGVLVAMTVPARRRINTSDFIERGRAMLERFENAAAGARSWTIVTSGQQAALQDLEAAGRAVATPLQRMEHALHPWVSFGIMPLFALANAGVALEGGLVNDLLHPISLGIALGLILGKPLGVTLLAWLTVRLGWADLPAGVGWPQVIGVGMLAGIGFTMSLFITGLAFGGTSLEPLAKIGILSASLLAGLLGWGLLRASASSGSGDAP
ncbi:MAG: Na+/H+ antiporter NhaA [Candidatus Bipolaricaulia bacterium]